jgi:hypothetical protein
MASASKATFAVTRPQVVPRAIPQVIPQAAPQPTPQALPQSQSTPIQAVPQASSCSLPQAIPCAITQDEITLFLSLRSRLHQVQSQIEKAEASIKERLEQGASVEPGDHAATLETSYRRNVSWKSVADRLAKRFKLYGYVDRVLAATRPTPVTSLEIN